MGLVMMIVGIYPIEATVTDVSSEVVSSSPGRYMVATAVLLYGMAYEYAVDGETYTGRNRVYVIAPSDWYCHYCEI